MPLNIDSQRIWQNYDVILYLCRFMEGQELVLFATSCRFIYQSITSFSLGDQKEQEWLTWYIWHTNAIAKSSESTLDANKKKRKRSLSPTITTNDIKDYECTLPDICISAIFDFDAAQWFYAYQRRRQTDRNFMAGQFKKRKCELPLNRCTQLKLISVNPWNALMKNRREMSMWVIRHGLAWKELTISSSALFEGNHRIDVIYGTHQYVVAQVFLPTYNDVKAVCIGDPIIRLTEMEARYIKDLKFNISNSSDKHYKYSATEYLKKRFIILRKALVVWRINGDSSPAILYLENTHKDNDSNGLPCPISIHNDWMFYRTAWGDNPRFEAGLVHLDKSQWVKGPRLSKHHSFPCIQFTSRDQCQFITLRKTHKSVQDIKTSASDATQGLQTTGDEIQTMCLQWDIFDARKGRSQCKKILSGQIAIPYCPNTVTSTKMYTEKMCLIIAWDGKGYRSRIPGEAFDASLSLFALDKFSPTASPQSIFDARDYGQLLPIDGCDQGHVIWSRPISHFQIKGLYREKLIVVQNDKTFDVLDACNGNLLRSVTYPIDLVPTPFLGSLCLMFSNDYKESWFVDVRTGCTYKPPLCLANNRFDNNARNMPTGAIETPPPAPSEYVHSEPSRYLVSNVIIGQISARGGSYEAFML
ncbi:hypothetical protein BDF19DRAFT_439516 [Syncephalis fuscata]|nr:hypothetical protein BDF19DRAFT_439516 [Syncephalis fuscata]